MSMDFYIKIKAQFITSAAIPQKKTMRSPTPPFKGKGGAALSFADVSL